MPPAGAVQGRTYQYQARAVDPDGVLDGPLTFQVATGPAGRGFSDPAHPGLLTWEVPASQSTATPWP